MFTIHHAGDEECCYGQYTSEADAQTALDEHLESCDEPDADEWEVIPLYSALPS